MTETKPIIIALSKGRILKDTMPLLESAGISFLEDPEKSRKLIFPTTREGVQIVIIRATDVPTFVDNGAADIGVAGKDVLLESGVTNLYEPLDLNIAKCRLMVAAKKNALPLAVGERLKVASKFVNITKEYFAGKGQQVDVIKLYGSMELAPLVGLADRIVDVVDTGKTLDVNGLEPTELIAHISSRLVVNKAAYKTRYAQIAPIIEALNAAVEAGKTEAVSAG